MNAQDRQDGAIALARIDSLMDKVRSALGRIANGETLSAADAVHKDEMVSLDAELERLAPKLYGRAVPAPVWEPPGGASFIRAAGSTDPSATLSAFLAGLSKSRAFVSALLNAVPAAPLPAAAGTPAPAASPLAEPTLLERIQSWAANRPLLAWPAAIIGALVLIAGGIEAVAKIKDTLFPARTAAAPAIEIRLSPLQGPPTRAADGRSVYQADLTLTNRTKEKGAAEIARRIELEICPQSERRPSSSKGTPFVDIVQVDKNNETDPLYRGSRGPTIQFQGTLVDAETIHLSLALVQPDAEVALRGVPEGRNVIVIEPATAEECAQQY